MLMIVTISMILEVYYIVYDDTLQVELTTLHQTKESTPLHYFNIHSHLDVDIVALSTQLVDLR